MRLHRLAIAACLALAACASLLESPTIKVRSAWVPSASQVLIKGKGSGFLRSKLSPPNTGPKKCASDFFDRFCRGTQGLRMAG